MRISYCYPNGNLRKRLDKIMHGLGDRYLNIEISEIIRDLYIEYGDEIFDKLNSVFKGAPNLDSVEKAQNLKAWINWLEDDVIPNEWRFLSPGAMSNAPDRFDGFHSFNLCCRKKADKGRSDKNLRTYNTDRRVFEFWNGGDWIAADRMMGKFPESFMHYECRIDGCSISKLTPDHLGPLSLGFAHRPTFGLMCNSHNSGKNNRLTLFDVEKLRQHQDSGEVVTSWQNESLWNILNSKVIDEESAGRLSKIMRDNQRIAMSIFSQIAEGGGHTFLSTFLNLQYSRYNVEFKKLRAEEGVTLFDKILKTPRESKQVEKQMLRRLRVAFGALNEYADKDNRHSWTIEDIWSSRVIEIVNIISPDSDESIALSRNIMHYVNGKTIDMDWTLNQIEHLTMNPPGKFQIATSILMDTLQLVSEIFAENWNSPRYVR